MGAEGSEAVTGRRENMKGEGNDNEMGLKRRRDYETEEEEKIVIERTVSDRN